MESSTLNLDRLSGAVGCRRLCEAAIAEQIVETALQAGRVTTVHYDNRGEGSENMIYVCGRKVKVQTGTKSQTVNVCTVQNIHGIYDYIVRIRQPFLAESALLSHGFRSIEDLISYLQRQHFGQVEQAPVRNTLLENPVSDSRTLIERSEGNSSKILCDPVKVEPALPWETNARIAVEQSIDQFVLEFTELPYLHRVEHSVHCELFNILTARKVFSRMYPMGRLFTRSIHKEWPEYRPRAEKGNRRGNFDLCVISPDRLRDCSFSDYREGRVRPSIVIEIGLDYNLNHLADDAAKLRNSGIDHSYLVHLVRQEVSDDFEKVEEFVVSCGIKTAYARMAGSRAYLKLVNDREVKLIETTTP